MAQLNVCNLTFAYEGSFDKVFDDVMGFLKTANATKKTVVELEKAIAESVKTEK